MTGAAARGTRRQRHASITWCARWPRSPGRICAPRSRGLDENNQPAVHFSLKPDGARKFGKITGENIGR